VSNRLARDLSAPGIEKLIRGDHKAACSQPSQGCKGRIKIAVGACAHDIKLQPEGAGSALQVLDKDIGIGTGWVDEGGKKGRHRDQLMQQLEPFRPKVRTQRGHPREVAAWMVEAGDKPACDWIAP
jgi:hypothetical protein